MTPILSVATTAHNEAGNVPEFLAGALNGVRQLGVTAEIIFIDDGSSDGTSDVVKQFAGDHPTADIRLIRHDWRQGIAVAIVESARLARGDYVCYLPSDLESRPEEDIPALYNAMSEECDLVVGWRIGRKGGKVLASRLYNLLNKWVFGVCAHDANWIKLVRREKLAELKLRRNWHSFLVAILVHRGCRLAEVQTRWYPRRYGRTKFGLRRLPAAVLSMLAVKLHLLLEGQTPACRAPGRPAQWSK